MGIYASRDNWHTCLFIYFRAAIRLKILITINRTINIFVCNVCNRANDTAEQVLSQGEYLRVSGLLHEMLCTLCDQAHDRCHKLLIARGKVGIELNSFSCI